MIGTELCTKRITSKGLSTAPGPLTGGWSLAQLQADLTQILRQTRADPANHCCRRHDCHLQRPEVELFFCGLKHASSALPPPTELDGSVFVFNFFVLASDVVVDYILQCNFQYPIFSYFYSICLYLPFDLLHRFGIIIIIQQSNHNYVNNH